MADQPLYNLENDKGLRAAALDFAVRGGTQSHAIVQRAREIEAYIKEG